MNLQTYNEQSGGWVVLKGVTLDPIEIKPDPDDDWGSKVQHTMRSFSASFTLTADASAELREAFAPLIRALNLIEAHRIHTAYRAKTRRRNRRTR